MAGSFNQDKEFTNYLRITRLLICGGTPVLIKLLDVYCPPTIGCSSLFNSLSRRMPISTKKWLQPANVTTFREKCLDLDITSIFTLLKEKCNILPLPTGWNALPNDDDLSLSADIVRVMCYQNQIYTHGNEKAAKLTDEEFKFFWENILGSLRRILRDILGTDLETVYAWENNVCEYLTSPVTEEDKRNVEQLKDWYLKDVEVEQLQSSETEPSARGRLSSDEQINENANFLDVKEEYVLEKQFKTIATRLTAEIEYLQEQTQKQSTRIRRLLDQLSEMEERVTLLQEHFVQTICSDEERARAAENDWLAKKRRCAEPQKGPSNYEDDELEENLINDHAFILHEKIRRFDRQLSEIVDEVGSLSKDEIPENQCPGVVSFSLKEKINHQPSEISQEEKIKGAVGKSFDQELYNYDVEEKDSSSTQTELPTLRDDFTQTESLSLVQEYRDMQVQTDPAQLPGSGQYLDQEKKDSLSLSCKEIQVQEASKNVKMPEPVDKETNVPQNVADCIEKHENRSGFPGSIKKKPALIYNKTMGQFEYIDDELKDKDVSTEDCVKCVREYWDPDKNIL